jgi:flagellar protein FliS
MDSNAHDSYLETQVKTATPQKLQLMLVEGAIRFAHQTIHHWEQQDEAAACDSLIRCRKIVTELLNNVRPKMSEAAKRAASVYLYLFQTLTDIQLHRQRERMADVLQVLEEERETWQTVCREIPDTPKWVERPAVEEVTSNGLGTIVPDTTDPASFADGPMPGHNGLSLEA